ncbi:MAG: hypothetical protein EXS16_15905, partial [Gemmataceae bacterium]|nr:hypothetical protein [Gemmataceae bacterium]
MNAVQDMLKFSAICIVAVAVLAFAPLAAHAKTYYLSQSSGNDSWSGEAATSDGKAGPWKTLAKASIEYKPGDRILLKCGDTWDEELRPKGNGTPDNPIVISSYGEGKRPVIDRQDFKQDL